MPAEVPSNKPMNRIHTRSAAPVPSTSTAWTSSSTFKKNKQPSTEAENSLQKANGTQPFHQQIRVDAIKNVLWLQVLVEDVFIVQKFHSFCDLAQNEILQSIRRQFDHRIRLRIDEIVQRPIAQLGHD